jgi:hypothetical protein
MYVVVLVICKEVTHLAPLIAKHLSESTQDRSLATARLGQDKYSVGLADSGNSFGGLSDSQGGVSRNSSHSVYLCD